MIVPSYVGVIINHDQDPYDTTRIQWKVISWLNCQEEDRANCPRILFLKESSTNTWASDDVFPIFEWIGEVKKEVPIKILQINNPIVVTDI